MPNQEMQAVFIRYELEGLDAEMWPSQRGVMEQVASRPGFRRVWPNLQGGFVAEFRTEVNQVGDPPPSAPHPRGGHS